jgi:hypothetical protein
VTYRRSRGRSKKGTRAFCTTKLIRGRNLTLIAAVSPVYGVLHYKIINKTSNGKEYATFLTELFNDYRFQTKSMIIIQDNSPIHGTKDVKKKRKEQFIVLLFFILTFFFLFFLFFSSKRLKMY